MSKVKKYWKKSEILQEALQYLAMSYIEQKFHYRKRRYVCFALEEVAEVARDNANVWKQVHELEDYIKELLVVDTNYQCDCYEEWLSVVHRITYEEKNTPEGLKKLQYSRKQWMLWMIEHFKQQGD